MAEPAANPDGCVDYAVQKSFNSNVPPLVLLLATCTRVQRFHAESSRWGGRADLEIFWSTGRPATWISYPDLVVICEANSHQLGRKRGGSAKAVLTSVLNRAGLPQGSAFSGAPERRGGDIL